MNGYLKRDHCGAWFFCTQAFGHVFDFPFEPGPDLNDNPPPDLPAMDGEHAHLTLQGAVLVERDYESGRWAWAGRIDPRSAVVGQERSAG